MADRNRWTDIKHLTAWDEEFYDIYTAKKFGKWVMLKTLKPEYRDKPEYCKMLEKEFDTRYNLAHPNIVMINDLEEIPGLGTCIVTDDVYGDTLRKLIDEKKVTQAHIDQLRHQLLNALSYIQANHIIHPVLRPENIVFTENIGNLKLIDVGFEQRPSLTRREIGDDIYHYGIVLGEALDAAGDSDATLHRVVRRCTDPNPAHRYRDLEQLRLALEGRTQQHFYIMLAIFLGLMLLLVAWLHSPWVPKPIK